MSSSAGAAPDISIRWSLFWELVLLILLISGSILGASVLAGARAVRTLSATLVAQTGERTQAELEHFFDPVQRSLLLARQWAQTGLLSDDPAQLSALLLPLLQSTPQISALTTGDAEGNSFMLLRQDNGYLNRIVEPGRTGKRVRLISLNEVGQAIGERWEEQDFDPRQRPWYQQARAEELKMQPSGASAVVWTDPYEFYTLHQVGMTAATVLRRPQGRSLVLGVDVTLTALSDFTSRLKVSRSGQVVVLSGSGQVVGLPADPAVLQAARGAGGLVAVSAVPGSVAERLFRMGGEAGSEGGAFSFDTDEGAWWGGLRRYDLGPQCQLLIGVAVPAADFLTDVKRLQLIVVIVTIAALGAAMLMALWMARRYSEPLNQLIATSGRIRDLDLRPGEPMQTNLLEFRRLGDALEQMRCALESFSLYAPTEVVRALLLRGEAARIGGTSQEITVLFTDIAGFTNIAESMTARALTGHMADYFDKLIEILQAHFATVDKYVGDAVVAFWGAPNDDPEHAAHAMEAILHARKRIAQLNQHWVARGMPPLPTRFGLATGNALVGNLGSHTRLSYTALGDTVNLASRLEGLNRVYGTEVLATESVKQACGDKYLWRRVDVVAVKGKSRSVAIYEPLGPPGSVPAGTLQFSQLYEEALTLYQSRRFTDALVILEKAETRWQDNLSLLRLQGLCRDLLHQPPAEDWQAVSRFEHK